MTKDLRGGGGVTGAIIINEELPVRPKPADKPKMVDPRKVNTLKDDDEDAKPEPVAKTEPTTEEAEAVKTPTKSPTKKTAKQEEKSKPTAEEMLAAYAKHAQDARAEGGVVLLPMTWAKLHAKGADGKTVKAFVDLVVAQIEAEKAERDELAEVAAASGLKPAGLVEVGGANAMERAVRRVIRQRVAQVAVTAVLGVMALIGVAYWMGYFDSVVLVGALTCAIVLGYPIKNVIEKVLNTFLEIKLYVKIGCVFALSAMLIFTGGLLWEWVISFSVIACLFQILVTDVSLAQAQTAVVEVTEEE